MREAIKCILDLPGDRQVCVVISVNTGPAIPTPHEPDVIRVPLMTEWPEILHRLADLEIDEMKTIKPHASYHE